MKDDAPLPDSVPRKRRQIESLLDRHIAVWLAGETLAPSDRRRLEEEKARRRTSVPDRLVGVLVGAAGVAPPQLDALPGLLAGATEVTHPGVSSRVHTACRSVGVPVVVRRDDPREVVRASDLVVAVLNGPKADGTEVWEWVRYARHRGVPVRAVLPDGQLLQGEGA